MSTVIYKVISQKPFVVEYTTPSKVMRIEYPVELFNIEFLEEFQRIKDKYNSKPNPHEKT